MCSVGFGNELSGAWLPALVLEGIRLLGKHKNISHFTMGSKPLFFLSTEGLAAGTGALRWRLQALTPVDSAHPTAPHPLRVAEGLLVLMTSWKSKPQRNFRVKAETFQGENSEPLCSLQSFPGLAAFLHFLRCTEQMWKKMGKMERVADIIFLGSKITSDSDCSHEIKRHLLLGRKVMTNLDGILKSRDITLPTKVCIVKAMVFPVVMYGCENWTIRKAEHQRINALEVWCWRRFLTVPWTARRSNQSILKEINPEYSFERLTLKLRLQYFGHKMRRAYSVEKTLMLEKTEGKRRRELLMNIRVVVVYRYDTYQG